MFYYTTGSVTVKNETMKRSVTLETYYVNDNSPLIHPIS